MIRKNFNLNSLFSDFDSLFNDFNSPYFVRGKKNVETGSDNDGKWSKETFTSDDGSYQVTSIVKYFTNDGKKPKESNEIKDLKLQLNEAVEKQDYESAAKFRDKIKSIESNKEKIDDLQSQLNKAVDEQDFENAIKLRDKLKKLKS